MQTTPPPMPQRSPYLPPRPPGPSDFSPFQMLVILLLGAIGLGLFTCSGAIFFAVKVSSDDPLQTMDVLISAPDVVIVGQKCEITVQITNVGDQSRTLHEIDLWEDEFEGLEFLQTDPPYVRIEDEYGIRSHIYRKPIEPGQQLIVKLIARAKKVGLAEGDVSVYIDSEMHNVMNWKEIVIAADAEDAERARKAIAEDAVQEYLDRRQAAPDMEESEVEAEPVEGEVQP